MAYKSRIPSIVAEIETELERAVNRSGFRIEKGAKDRARVASGYMRGQIRWKYMEMPVGFTGDRNEPLKWVPSKRFTGTVAGGATYTFFNEFGTVNMSAQPMIIPAAEEARPLFVAGVTRIIRRAVDSGRL